MLIVALICVALAGVALYIGGYPRLRDGVAEGGALLVSVAPQLALGFLMAGLATVLIPQAAIARLVGEGSGIQGLVVATAAGAVTPGGPFLQFPLVAVLMRNGASEGAVAAYLTAWSLLGLQRVLIWELPVLGPTFATARWAVSMVAPVAVGLAVPMVLRLVRAP